VTQSLLLPVPYSSTHDAGQAPRGTSIAHQDNRGGHLIRTPNPYLRRRSAVQYLVMFLPLAFMFLVLPGLSMSAHALPSNSAPAPNCVDETFGEALNRSAVVFSGRVLQVDLVEETQIVRFLVTRRWKGLRTSKVTITNVLHLEGSPDFQSGKSYLVFALLDQGKFHIRGCSWTVALQDRYARERITMLNRWKARHRTHQL
jgi:hypothetical protein